ncbi:MAG: hemolysin family protein [Anaerorhabdus sp.]|uniref:hemolysin family protein n=1 Tax=Anaerorhabdus sp. TaxID=1872524 RepID=UPI002FC9CB9E
MSSQLVFQLFLQAFLILLNAVFACAEIAVISMNDAKLEQLVNEKNKKAIRLKKLTDQPAKFLATIQVAITLSGFLGSAFAADNFSEMLVTWLVSVGVNLPVSTLDTISVVIITLILSYFTLVFGELVPKRLAMKKAEKLALGMSSLITTISNLFKPIVWALTASTNGILRLLGIDPNQEDEEVSEEEIRMMVDIGNKKGVIEEEEKQMIQNVFEFNDTELSEIATHRMDVKALQIADTLDAWELEMKNSRYSYYPVCDGTVDHIVGVLNIKDYFRLKNKTKELVVNTLIRPAQYALESMTADVLFKKMRSTRNHFAVVLDEYGGMFGIITMNDLLEELVGDLENDIYQKDDEEIVQVANNAWEIIGNASLEDVSEQLGVSLPTDTYETFGGFIFGTFEELPKVGAQFTLNEYKLEVKIEEIKHYRIEKARVTKME